MAYTQRDQVRRVSAMRFPAAFLLCGSFTCASALHAQTSSSHSKAVPDRSIECSISGTVVKLAGSEPMKNATVQLFSSDDHSHGTSIVTDVGGRFTLKGLFPGRYRLIVSKNGFVDQEFGQRKPGDPGSLLTLHAGQDLRDLLFRMIPSAVISGRVLNEEGEPLPLVAVTALREIYSDGKRKLRGEAEFETNDLGEYRLFGLPPGRYLISVVYRGKTAGFQMPQARPANDAPETGYGRLYYPGLPDASGASAIGVKAGEEIPSIEMMMRRFPVYRVSGRVLNLIPRQPGSTVYLTLQRRGTALEWEQGEQSVNVDAREGTFEIHDVLPGSYSLMAYLFDQEKRYVSRTNIEVSNSDLEGVAVAIAPGVSVPGRILWDGQPCALDGDLRVSPWPVDPGGVFIRTARVPMPLTSFTLAEVSEGTYRARLSGLSKDCFIKDVQFGGTSALDDGFTVVRGTPAMLEITLSACGARLQGSVVDADNLPAVGVWVVLVPDAKHRSRYDLFKYQSTDQYGHFDFRGLAPGEYKLFSWEQVETNAWQDPDFLKAFEDKGETIDLKESDQKSANVVAIRRMTGDDNKP